MPILTGYRRSTAIAPETYRVHDIGGQWWVEHHDESRRVPTTGYSAWTLSPEDITAHYVSERWSLRDVAVYLLGHGQMDLWTWQDENGEEV